MSRKVINVVTSQNNRIYNMIDFIFNNENAIESNPTGMITFSDINQAEYESIKNCEILESFMFYGSSNEDENRMPLTFRKTLTMGDDVYFSCVQNVNDYIVYFFMKVSPTKIEQGMFNV